MSNASSSYTPDTYDTSCDKCGAPASWAEHQNLSYRDSLRHHLYTWLNSPRMWPIGYITGSPYSPLNIELQIPSQNWRDAFEDLIALESGGRMISSESRKNEAQVAARLRYENVYNQASRINEMLDRDAKSVSLLQRLRAFAARNEMEEAVAIVDEALPWERSRSQERVQLGHLMIAKLKEDERENWPASKYKRRGHWISSLVTSGALPGWTTRLYDSADGPHIEIEKSKSEDDQEEDGQQFTDLELEDQFEKGIALSVGSPDWSTSRGRYPTSELITNIYSDGSTDYTAYETPSVHHSILKQLAKAERTKLANSSFSTKVIIKNRFTDDEMQEKEIVDDPCRVLEEVNKAYTSMLDRKHAVALAIRDIQYEEREEPLKEGEALEAERA